MSKKLCRIFVLLGFLAAFTSSALACRPVLIIILGFEDNTYGFQEVYENFPSSGITGTFQSCGTGCSGSTSSFSGTTDSSGAIDETGHSVPATWRIGFGSNTYWCNGDYVNQSFIVTTSAQVVSCTTLTGDSLSASPSSGFDTSTGTTSFTTTITDGSEAWPRTPTNVVAYGPSGWASSGSLSYIDSHNVSVTFSVGPDPGMYGLWLSDTHGYGIGIASVAVTNGSGGGG